MYNIDEIKQVHLEITQRCQASCSMCDRNMNGGDVNPHLTMAELKIDDIKKIFDPSILKQLNSIQICGNHGDPIIADDLLLAIEYFREHNSTMWIALNTNAGARSAEWWTRLAKLLGNSGAVIFSVDGLEDTNHIYRQGVSWKAIKQAMKSFIAAGGRARWDFLVFSHNEHQVDEARELSEHLGFEKFIVKKSSRFVAGPSLKKKDSHQAVNRKGENTAVIKEPEKDTLKNPVVSSYDRIIAKYGSMDEFHDVSKISCRVKGQGSLYISAEGIVMPCCWTAGRMYKWWHSDPKTEQIWNYIDEAGGKDALDAKKVGLSQVFKTGIFENIEKSWNIKGCKNGRLKVCAMKCSTEFDVVDSQYE